MVPVFRNPRTKLEPGFMDCRSRVLTRRLRSPSGAAGPASCWWRGAAKPPDDFPEAWAPCLSLWVSRGAQASPVSRPSESPLPGVQPRGPPTVAETTPGQSEPGDATPEMRVAGNQGQGPGHNEAIVGLQSVDFQAAVPHPPSLLLPTPDPCQEVTQIACLLISLRPKGAAFWVLPLEAPAGPPLHCLFLPPGGGRAPHF